MDVNKRQTAEHVEWELEDWRSAFYLDMRFLSVFQLLAANLGKTVAATSCFQGVLKLETKQETQNEIINEKTISWSQVQQLIRDFTKHLLESTQNDGIRWRTIQYNNPYGIEFSNSRSPVHSNSEAF